MKTDLFQFCGHCWVFQICWHIEGSTFTASTFRIWNRSTGIPSPPLTLLVVMLPKAHLMSHSRMSGSRWVIPILWLSGSWRYLLYSSSVYFCHLFLISSASVRSLPFLFFFEPIFAWNVLLICLIEFCQDNALVIANTLFQQHKRRLYTWTLPDGRPWNQIDYILWSQIWRSSTQLAQTRLGADCGSNHELLIAKFRLK